MAMERMQRDRGDRHSPICLLLRVSSSFLLGLSLSPPLVSPGL
jgi:hypothetical protein